MKPGGPEGGLEPPSRRMLLRLLDHEASFAPIKPDYVYI